MQLLAPKNNDLNSLVQINEDSILSQSIEGITQNSIN